MKFKIGPVPEKESTIYLELSEDTSGEVTLTAQLENGYAWNLISFAPKGIYLYGCISEKLGLPLDSQGRLKFILEDDEE